MTKGDRIQRRLRLEELEPRVAPTATTIHITTVQQLQEMNKNPSANYILENDLNALFVSSAPVGAPSRGAPRAASSPFNGTFDGQGHKIYGLTINLPNQDYVGLFGYCTGGSVKIQNLGLANANITGRHYVGALASRGAPCDTGSLGGNIFNCYTEQASVSGGYAGGNYVEGLLSVFGDRQAVFFCPSAGRTAGLKAGRLVGLWAKKSHGRVFLRTGSASLGRP